MQSKNKLKLIEEIDRELLRYEKSFRECQVALLIDHGASSVTGEHMRMKVPYAVAEAGEGEGEERVP